MFLEKKNILGFHRRELNIALSWDIKQAGALILLNSDDIEVKFAGWSEFPILKAQFCDNSIPYRWWKS